MTFRDLRIIKFCEMGLNMEKFTKGGWMLYFLAHSKHSDKIELFRIKVCDPFAFTWKDGYDIKVYRQ